jgi:two-component system, OmpR family, response regulator
MRVLVVEDEQDLADAIAAGLRREGYAVDLAHAGDEALVKARVYPYDLICLDLNLPAVGGRDVCRAIRSEQRPDGAPQPRILMLTARAGVDDRIAGLDDGADDYLVKPFDFGEMLARLRALTRREPTERPAVVEVADLRVDPASHVVTRAGREVDLTPREFALLLFLARRAGEVVPRTELLEQVWDEADEGSTNVVDVYVGYLRKKLERPFRRRRLIRTVRGVGFMLEEPE